MNTRGDLTERQWARLQTLLPPEKGKRERPARSHREVLNGIFWAKCTGASWRDLPTRYPPSARCHSRLTVWQRAGCGSGSLQVLLAEADLSGEMDWVQAAVDSATVRPHHHAAGARRRPA